MFAGGVAPASAAQMRREQHVHLQARMPGRVGFDACMDQYAGASRVGNDLLDDAIALLRIAHDDPISKRIAVETGDLAFEVALFFVKERLPVGNEELQIANLGSIYRRVIDFVEDTMREREPHAARVRIGRADALLRTRRPAWRNAGITKRLCRGLVVF